MILKGNQRGGARQMALHLLNGEQNEHVNVHEVRGFMADDVLGALNEAYAISKGTRCKQFMYALSLNPPPEEKVSIETFEKTLERIEKKLGLEGQPRVVVFHEKVGRRHAHCVWSQIDTEKMRAVNMSHDHTKLNVISKSLYLEMGWKLPEGFIDKSKKNPLNFTRAEWQQALRTGQNPKVIKAALQECWALSDNKKSFENALSERGYMLARGDKRGFVAVDMYGEVYSLTRQLKINKKDLEAKVGTTDRLPSVDTAKDKMAGQISGLFKKFMGEQDKDHHKALRPLLKTKADMTKQHRAARTKQKAYQEQRWQQEENKRAARMRKGFKGLWDKLTGAYWKLRKQNEREAYQAYKRDQKERETLIHSQLSERQNLQNQFDHLRTTHEQERTALLRDLSYVTQHNKDKNTRTRTPEKSQTRSANKHQGKDPDLDNEPEI